jgi:hypothetical protein
MARREATLVCHLLLYCPLLALCLFSSSSSFSSSSLSSSSSAASSSPPPPPLLLCTLLFVCLSDLVVDDRAKEKGKKGPGRSRTTGELWCVFILFYG